MIQLKKALTSTVGRKYIMALSGVALVVFIIVHLAENILLFEPGGALFNRYVSSLDSLGVLKLVAELGLLAVFLIHIVSALAVTTQNKRARGQGYKAWKSKSAVREGLHPEDLEKSNVSSRNMIITGVVLLLFLVIHVGQFRFGPGLAENYATTIDGHQVRDLYRLVFETFHRPAFVGVYTAAMFFLGLHFRHGFWSMFQSLGLMNPKFSRPIHMMGLVLAILLAAGFLSIPLVIYCRSA